ncbi:MAG: hypothetical protein CVV03_11605 [Firmicutes bacterium HGW-Firmicutes-8]|nr:MAG: hypothetical protein CVV03_11605 [Firmicutes bacterium HGW-Firmicutes-8]
MSKIKVAVLGITIISILVTGCGIKYSRQASFAEPGLFKGKIVFVSDREASDRKIYIVNADGTNLRLISTKTNSNDTPAFSPDGEKIAFEGGLSKNDVSEIFITNGSSLTQLTDYASVDTYKSPKWTADGKTIFFVKHEGATKHFTIYRYDLTSKKEQKVLDNAGGSDISVSPDGRYLAYEYPDVNSDIYVKDLISGLTVNLTKGNGKEINYHPSWSPDGKKIAFTNSSGRHIEVYVMESTGENIQRITDNSWSEESPAWSPDGTKLIYTSHRYGDPWGGGELFVMDLNNMTEWQITRAVQTKDGTLSSDIQASWTN